MEILHLEFTNLEGTFPEALATLTNLKTLHLSNNPLVGTIPESYCQLENLGESARSFCASVHIVSNSSHISIRFFTELVGILATGANGTMPKCMCDLVQQNNLTIWACQTPDLVCDCCASTCGLA